jgi:hypothetical protein
MMKASVVARDARGHRKGSVETRAFKKAPRLSFLSAGVW